MTECPVSGCPNEGIGQWQQLCQDHQNVFGKQESPLAVWIADESARAVRTMKCTFCDGTGCSNKNFGDTFHKCPECDGSGRLEVLEVTTPGRKDDQGKGRWDLLPWDAARQVVDVLTYGAKKYDPDNWRKVPDWSDRYFSAAMRHLVAWHGGQRNDPESGHHHLAHALCCILFLLSLDGGSEGG